MLLLVATLLASTPSPPMTHVVSRGVRTRLDVGGLLGASWYVEPSRHRIEAAWTNAKFSFLGDATLDGQTMLYATPIVGPWMLSRLDGFDASDRFLLLTTGALQLVGLTVSAYRFGSDELVGTHEGLELSISPIAGGRLGFALKLTGF